jgi:hypothetical protein
VQAGIAEAGQYDRVLATPDADRPASDWAGGLGNAYRVGRRGFGTRHVRVTVIVCGPLQDRIPWQAEAGF